MTCASASTGITATTLCLRHQLPEDQPTSLGLLCPLCKEHIQRQVTNGFPQWYKEQLMKQSFVDGEKATDAPPT